MAVNNFDFIAPFYDQLAKLVFGKALLQAQLIHLTQIEENDHVLILGGGTGRILEQFPICNQIDFVEKSKKMIMLAKKRMVKRHIDFKYCDFFEYKPNRKYDIVICPFFLDCFNQEQLEEVLNKIKLMLSKNGHLLVADFRSTKSNRWILRIMHLFFRLFANLEARYLLDIHQMVISAGFEVEKEKFLHRKQLFSRLYRNL